MKVTIEDAGGCRRIMHVEVPAEAVEPAYAAVVQAFRKEAKIPGFRPGKTPADVIAKRFGPAIDAEARERLVPAMVAAALKQEKLQPEAIAKVSDVTLSRMAGMTFKVALDIAPDFKLPKYQKLAVKPNPVAVDADEVQKAFEHLLEQFSRFEEVAGRPVAAGDLAQVTFRGECDGQPVAALDKAAAGLGEGKDFWMLVGEPEILPGMAAGLLGMAVGETRTVPVAFPADFRVAALAGKSAVYTVTLAALRERIRPTLDAEFFKRFEVDSEVALREKVRADLLEGARQRELARVKEEIARTLLKQTDLELPKAVVDHETGVAARGILQRMTQSGATREQIQEQHQAIIGAAAQSSTERVKLSYILRRIADEEHIELSENELEARLQDMAAAYRTAPAQLRAELERRGTLDDLRQDLRNAKTLDRLAEIASAS